MLITDPQVIHVDHELRIHPLRHVVLLQQPAEGMIQFRIALHVAGHFNGHQFAAGVAFGHVQLREVAGGQGADAPIARDPRATEALFLRDLAGMMTMGARAGLQGRRAADRRQQCFR